MEDRLTSHEQLLVIVIGMQGIVGGGLGWAISRIWQKVNAFDAMLLQDHVHRPEFEALRSRIDLVAERQSSVLATLTETTRQIERLETQLVTHIKRELNH